jgi:hypothetical protein
MQGRRERLFYCTCSSRIGGERVRLEYNRTRKERISKIYSDARLILRSERSTCEPAPMP